MTRQYYAMALDRVNRNRILAGTQDNGTNARGDNGGTGWSSFSGGDGFQILHPSRCAERGLLHLSVCGAQPYEDCDERLSAHHSQRSAVPYE